MHVSCPSDIEKNYYALDNNRHSYYLLGFVSIALLLSGMALFIIGAHAYWYLLFWCLLVFYLSVSYFIGIFGGDFDFPMHRFRVWQYRDSPSVDIFIPSCNEQISVIHNTYSHVQKLWADYKNAFVWVLDDAKRDDVLALASRYGFNYIARPNSGEMKKAGNIKYAVERTKSEFFLILDCDFCPRPDMLREMLPYMQDEKVAIVQTPQWFRYNSWQSWMEKGAGQVQELFYRLIQVSRDSFRAPVCVGTNALYRRAIFPNGTYQIPYSEDVHTGWDATCRGYLVKYVPVILAGGECPGNIGSFFSQQYRWAMGSISLCTNKLFWTRKLSFMQRTAYLSGFFYYICTGLEVFFGPLPSLFMVWRMPEHVVWYSLFFTFPSFIFGTFYQSGWSIFPWGVYSLAARKVSYWAHFFALVDKIRGSLMPWEATGSAGSSTRVTVFYVFFMLWTLVSFLGVLSGVYFNSKGLDDYRFYPTMFFSLVQLYIAIYILLVPCERQE